MSIGTLATMIANYTPVFSIIGQPFIPILELLQIPEAAKASETLLIGFADMFLPSILIADAHSEITRFVWCIKYFSINIFIRSWWCNIGF